MNRRSALFVGALMLTTFVGRSDAFRSNPEQEPLLDRERVRKLAGELLAGNPSAADALVELGPPVVPWVEDLFETPIQKKQLEGIVEILVRRELDRAQREEEGLVYHGQFEALEVLGVRASRVLFGIFRDEDERREVRSRAASAMGDIGDASLLPELRKVVDDFLTEDWVEDDAGFLMARLGDRFYVDRLIETAEKVVSQVATTQNLPAILAGHTTLAEVYYRVGDYPEAIKHYQQKLAILSDLATRVRKELRAGVEEEMTLLKYNMACSLSLAGRIDDAFEALGEALDHRDVTLDMIRTDGDLRAVRADPRYSDWLKDREKP